MTSFPAHQARAFNYWLYGTSSLIILTLIAMGSITLSYLKSIQNNKKALIHCYSQQQELIQTKQYLAQLEFNESNRNNSQEVNTSAEAILANLNHLTELLDEDTRLNTFQMNNQNMRIVGQSNSIEQALAFYTKLSESDHFNTLHLVSIRPHEELTEFVINGQV